MSQRTGARTSLEPDGTVRTRPSPRALAGVCGPMSVAAAAGAVGLATGALDLGAEVTARLPGASPLLAGAALGLVVALPMGATTVAGWRRSARTADLGVLAGTALIGWIAVEIAVIRTFSWLQPICASYGALVLGLALLLRGSNEPRRAP